MVQLIFGWKENGEKSYNFSHITQPKILTMCPICRKVVEKCDRCGAFFQITLAIPLPNNKFERGGGIACDRGSIQDNYSHICGYCKEELKKKVEDNEIAI